MGIKGGSLSGPRDSTLWNKTPGSIADPVILEDVIDGKRGVWVNSVWLTEDLVGMAFAELYPYSAQDRLNKRETP